MSEAQKRKAAGEPVDWTATSPGERVEHVCQLRGWSLNKLGEEAGLASGAAGMGWAARGRTIARARRACRRAGRAGTLAPRLEA